MAKQKHFNFQGSSGEIYMKHQLVLKQGLLSEKIYTQMESGIYTFLVSKEATKDSVKKAIENQFGTKVLKVNILSRASKKRRVTGTRKMVDTGVGKKAVIYLKAGEKIAMLSPKTESKKKKDKQKLSKESNASQLTNEEKGKKKGLLSRIRGKSTNEKEESSN